MVFEDSGFFGRFRPCIIIETHVVGGVETTDKSIRDLTGYGYRCRRIDQIDVTLPHIECYPLNL